MLKYWLNTNTHLNVGMKATQYIRSVRPVRRETRWSQMHLNSVIGRGHWARSWRHWVSAGRWVIS